MSIENSSTIYITGLSAAGKTTLAYRLLYLFKKENYNVVLLDGTEMYTNSILFPFKGHEPSDRESRSDHSVRIAKWLSNQGILPIVAVIGQPLSIREKWTHEITNFHEIYLKCKLETCIERDNKELYNSQKIIKTGSIVGVSSDFIEPPNPWLKIETDSKDSDEVADITWKNLKTLNWLSNYKYDK